MGTESERDTRIRGHWPLVGRDALVDELVAVVAGRWTRAVVLHGPAGVGKTRVATEVYERARAAGRAASRVTASVTVAGVPLGALAPLLPAEVLGIRGDPVALFGGIAQALRAQGFERPFLFLVDDVPRLDLSSIGLISQLLDEHLIFLLGTQRTGEAVPRALEELWRRDYVEHRDIGPLDERETDRLMQEVLRGPLEAATRAALWTVTQGNALFLHEMVTEASSSGALAYRRGVWRLEGPLPQPRRLIDLLDSRLAGLDASASAAVEILAASAISLDDLVQESGGDAVETLERRGIIEVSTDGRRHLVALSHPLYEELVRSRMPVLTRRRLLRARAEAVEARGARRHDDALTIAIARLDAATDVDPVLAVKAARIARQAHDFAQVERLARAALAVEPTPASVMLLAEALYDAGACAQCEQVFADHAAVIAAAPRDEAVMLAGLRVRNLLYNCQRPDEALAVIDEARRRLGADDPELLAHAASLALNTGEPARALEMVRRVQTTAWRPATARAVVEERALMVAGACEEAADLAQRWYEEHSRHVGAEDAVALSDPDIHLIHRVHALTEAGRFAEASALAESASGEALRAGPAAGSVWLAYHRGRIALLQGRVVDARRLLTDAAVLAGQWDYVVVHRLVLALLAMAHSWLGDAAAARAAVDELDWLPPFAYLAPEQQMGEAWVLVAEGDHEAARRRLAALAAEALDAGWRTSAAWALHDLARLGEPRTARDGLDALADIQSLLVPAYRVHADALATGSVAGLTEAADRFETVGALLLAAEACTEAAQAGPRGERESRATGGLRSRATLLLARCGPVVTPALQSVPAAADPLTAREREIATLATRLSSREIAEQLYLSTRTVNNHLQRVYVKLGVGSRAELIAALDAAEPAGPR